MANKHRTTWKEYPDESQEHCLDCPYVRAVPKDLAGKRTGTGRVLRQGDSSVHSSGTYGPVDGVDIQPVG